MNPVDADPGRLLRPADTSTSARLTALLTQRDAAQAELTAAETALSTLQSKRQTLLERVEGLRDAAAADETLSTQLGRLAGLSLRSTGDVLDMLDGVLGEDERGLGDRIRTAIDRPLKPASDAESALDLALEREERRLGISASEYRRLAATAEAEAGAISVIPAEQRVAAAVGALAEVDRQIAEERAAIAVQATSTTSWVPIVSVPLDAGQLSAAGWANPVTGRLTDGFGPRPQQPVPGVNPFHRGTDIAAGCGAGVYAATDGVVLEARHFGTYGNWILIQHGEEVATGYAHLEDGGILVKPGDTVHAGQLIGLVGSTGASTGCHLHYEVRVNGAALDAELFMAARGIALGR